MIILGHGILDGGTFEEVVKFDLICLPRLSLIPPLCARRHELGRSEEKSIGKKEKVE